MYLRLFHTDPKTREIKKKIKTKELNCLYIITKFHIA